MRTLHIPLVLFLVGCDSVEPMRDYRCSVEQHEKAIYEAREAHELGHSDFNYYYRNAIIRNCDKFVDTEEKSQ